MNIKLKWQNRNTLAVSAKIYRNETIVPNDQLANPIATVPGSQLEYTDTTAVRRKTYYYVIETTDGNNRAFSLPIKVFADFGVGPGPRTLIWGTPDYGYFGTIDATDFFTALEVSTLSASSGSYPNNVAGMVWHKWMRRGKVLYVPSAGITTLATITGLYSDGLVHGMSGPGPWKPTGAVDVDQMKTLEKGYDKFIVRLPTGADDRNNPSRAISGSGQTVAVRRFSEWADLIYPFVANYVPTSQRAPNTESTSLIGQITNGRQPLSCTMFGTTGTIQGTPAGAASGAELEAVGAILAFSGSASWFPLIELIPQTPVVEVAP